VDIIGAIAETASRFDFAEIPSIETMSISSGGFLLGILSMFIVVHVYHYMAKLTARTLRCSGQ
jgi:hypothetical protein